MRRKRNSARRDVVAEYTAFSVIMLSPETHIHYAIRF